MPLALFTITTPILALLVAYLWFKMMQQAKTLKDVTVSVGDIQKALAQKRSEEIARVSQVEAEATDTALKDSVRKSKKRTRKN